MCVPTMLSAIAACLTTSCAALSMAGSMVTEGPAAVMEETVGMVDTDAGPEPLPTRPPDEAPPEDYDFAAGTRTLFAEDFEGVTTTSESLSGIPAAGSVVEENGLRLLKVTEYESRLRLELDQELPEAFTIELSVYDPEGWEGVAVLTTTPHEAATWRLRYREPYFVIGHRDGSGVHRGRGGGVVDVAAQEVTKAALWPVRVRVDGSTAEVWVGYDRVAMAEDLDMPRSDEVYLMIPVASESSPIYIDDIRIAAIR